MDYHTYSYHLVSRLQPVPTIVAIYVTPLLFLGVAGFVVNEKNEVLLVQEKWLRNLKIIHWKLPGGHAEPGLFTHTLSSEIE